MRKCCKDWQGKVNAHEFKKKEDEFAGSTYRYIVKKRGTYIKKRGRRRCRMGGFMAMRTIIGFMENCHMRISIEIQNTLTLLYYDLLHGHACYEC